MDHWNRVKRLGNCLPLGYLNLQAKFYSTLRQLGQFKCLNFFFFFFRQYHDHLLAHFNKTKACFPFWWEPDLTISQWSVVATFCSWAHKLGFYSPYTWLTSTASTPNILLSPQRSSFLVLSGWNDKPIHHYSPPCRLVERFTLQTPEEWMCF